MPQIPIAVQMYTVRDAAARDFIGALKRVAEIGYAGVELAGTPVPAADIKRACVDLGLAVPSMHVGYDDVVKETDRTIKTGLELGVNYLTCASLPRALRQTEEGYRQAAAQFSVAGEIAAAFGLSVCYHNHDAEFRKLNGKIPYDILFGESDPRFVKAEVDTYWVEFAGESAAARIRSLTGRCPLTHMKDMANDKERSFAEVGTGIMDFAAIIDACKAAGVEWYVVEQDACKRDPFESIGISLENMRILLKAES